jgi:hypothetical protein
MNAAPMSTQLELFAAPTKLCPQCQQSLPMDQFPGWEPGRAGMYCYCAPCRRTYRRTYNRAYKQRTPSERRARGLTKRYITERIPRLNQLTIGRYRYQLMADPCSYCGEMPATCKWTGRPLGTLDHIEPRSKDGLVQWDNETASCWSCNRYKRAESLLTFLLKIQARTT